MLSANFLYCVLSIESHHYQDVQRYQVGFAIARLGQENCVDIIRQQNSSVDQTRDYLKSTSATGTYTNPENAPFVPVDLPGRVDTGGIDELHTALGWSRDHARRRGRFDFWTSTEYDATLSSTLTPFRQ
jgi:hypothetical protein